MTFRALLILSVVTTSVPSLASGQAPRPREDGDFWRASLTEHDRGLYALGLIEGATFLSSGLHALEQSPNSQVFQKYLAGVSARTLGDGLDAFYGDFRNRRIRIGTASMLVLLQIRGAPNVESLIETMRQLATREIERELQ